MKTNYLENQLKNFQSRTNFLYSHKTFYSNLKNVKHRLKVKKNTCTIFKKVQLLQIHVFSYNLQNFAKVSIVGKNVEIFK